MFDFWEMRNTLSLPLFPDPFLPVVVAPDRALSMGRLQLFEIKTGCK